MVGDVAGGWVFIPTMMKPANHSAWDVFQGAAKEEIAAYVISLPSRVASLSQIVMLYCKRADAESTEGRWPARLLFLTYNL